MGLVPSSQAQLVLQNLCIKIQLKDDYFVYLLVYSSAICAFYAFFRFACSSIYIILFVIALQNKCYVDEALYSALVNAASYELGH